MNTDRSSNSQSEKSTLSLLWQDVRKYKSLYAIVLGVTLVVSVIMTKSIPNYYTCTVKLAPELSGSNKNSSGLASVASSFGVNLGGNSNGADAIVPTLYPELMNSVTFKTSLFPVRIQREEDDSTMTYYDYLLNHQRKPWWSAAKSAISSFFNSESSNAKPQKVNPFRLTNEQSGVIALMNQKVVCDVDNMTMVISINVTDQDPLIAATMADSVQVHLQKFITDYRTRKARIDLAYNQKLYKETRERYEKARRRSASYSDANQRAFLNRVISEASDLENEMEIQLRAYSQVAAQLQAAEAKVQEDTPAFTLLQPATVPVQKAGPGRSRTCITILILVLLATTIFVWGKEKHLKLLFKPSKEEFDFDELSMDDLAALLSKKTSKNDDED